MKTKTLKHYSVNAICIATFILLTSCGNSPNTATADNNVNINTATLQDSNSVVGGGGSQQKSQEELIFEASEQVVDLAGKLIDNHKRKDSILLANKEKVFAYQIGLPISDKDEVIEAFKKIKDIPNVSVFKVDGDEYYIVRYDGKQEQELMDSLGNFKTQIKSLTSGDIKILNMTSLCDKKEEVKQKGRIKVKKDDLEIHCLICD